MQRFQLDLGDDPWRRLSFGRVAGTVVRDDGPRLKVSVRIRGAHSRRFPKKSLQVDLTRVKMEDEPPVGHKVRRIHLNADYVDPTRMRSALSYWLFERMNVPAPRCRHGLVTVNREFSGLYVVLESVDRDFCRRRGWKLGPIYYAVSRHANFGLVSPVSGALKHPLEVGYQPVQRADTTPLRRMLMEINLASARSFPGVVERWFDVPLYLRWLMVAVFVGNRDGFVHNYALWFDPDQRQFRIIPWDYDATWGINIHGRPARIDRVPLEGWNRLSQRLLESSRYRSLYRRLFQQALDGPLSPDSIDPRIDTMSREIAAAIDKERTRWPAAQTFAEDVADLRDWAERRWALLRDALRRF